MIGVTTMGADGGKSGISWYLLNLLREWSLGPSRASFEVLAYPDEVSLFGTGLRTRTISTAVRHPVVNVLWHQLALPVLSARYRVVFLPAGNRRLPVWSSVPTVGTVHDLASMHLSDKYDAARTFYVKRAMPVLIRRLTEVIAVSEFTKRDLVELAGVPEERVTVIHSAADASLYFPRDREESVARVRARYGVGERPYVLYLSRIEHPGKNHVRLIRAFDRLKQRHHVPHQLVLAGSDWTRAEEVHAEAARAKHRDAIVFTGFASTESLPDLYCACDLFIFPSLFEGFGMPIVEAMACGVPVACSNRASMPEAAGFLPDGRGGFHGGAAHLFSPEVEEEITETMAHLLGNDALRAEMARASLRRNALLNWKTSADRHLAVFERASSGGSVR